MRRILYSLFIILLILIGIAFTVLNFGVVTLNLYFVQFDKVPLAVLVLIAALIGALLGVLVCAGALMKRQHELRGLRKKAERAEQEVQNLRNIPIKGSLP